MEKATPFVPCLSNDNLFANLKGVSERNFSFRGMHAQNKNHNWTCNAQFFGNCNIDLFQILIPLKKKKSTCRPFLFKILEQQFRLRSIKTNNQFKEPKI